MSGARGDQNAQLASSMPDRPSGCTAARTFAVRLTVSSALDRPIRRPQVLGI